MRGTAFGALLLSVVALAVQLGHAQTGAIVRRPGEPLRGPVAIPVPPPPPSLAPSILNSFNGTLLVRRESGIFIARGGDRFARRVFEEEFSASLSPDSRLVAYFDQEEMHLLTLAADGSSQSDTVLEDLPEAHVAEIVWSADGAMLAYDVHSKVSPGVHVVSLATHAVRAVGRSAGGVAFSADGRYVLGVDPKKGLTRVRLTDGAAELLYPTNLPPSWGAKFSSTGLVGVLMPVPHPPSSVPDNEPDCTGAQLQLEIVRPGGKSWTLPFPKGFDNVYDFEFSPDGAEVVVGFGTVSCDYPGGIGAVYLVTLGDGGFRRLTAKDEIALKGRFSPNGKQITYTSFSATGSPSIFMIDLKTGKSAPLLAPDAYGHDEVLDWR